jgi:uncharacterized protein YceK
MHIYTVPQIFQMVDILFINLVVTLAGCPCVTTIFFKKTKEYLVTYAKIQISLKKISNIHVRAIHILHVSKQEVYHLNSKKKKIIISKKQPLL